MKKWRLAFIVKRELYKKINNNRKNIKFHNSIYNLKILTLQNIFNIITNGDEMNIEEYKSLPELANKLKTAIDSHEKKLVFPDSQTILSWKELVSYLGDTFAIPRNRQRALSRGGFAKTIHSILRGGRVETLRKALKEYDLKLYEDL